MSTIVDKVRKQMTIVDKMAGIINFQHKMSTSVCLAYESKK
jgi:hypothetical protein